MITYHIPERTTTHVIRYTYTYYLYVYIHISINKEFLPKIFLMIYSGQSRFCKGSEEVVEFGVYENESQTSLGTLQKESTILLENRTKLTENRSLCLLILHHYHHFKQNFYLFTKSSLIF